MLTFPVVQGFKEDPLTRKTLPLTTFALWPLLCPLIFCPDETACLLMFALPLLFFQISYSNLLKTESKTNAQKGKHNQSFIDLDRRVPSSALTEALDKAQPKCFLSSPKTLKTQRGAEGGENEEEGAEGGKQGGRKRIG